MTTFALLVGCLVVGAGADSGRVPASLARWGDTLVVADGSGAVRAYRGDGQAQVALTSALGATPLFGVAADGATLFGFDLHSAFSWSGERWQPLKPKAELPCRAFSVVQGQPVAVCGPNVFRFSDGRSFKGPEFHDQIRGRGFGASVSLASHDALLAIGTGFGEWGGYLWVLDLSTGKWNRFYDALGYPVGVTWADAGWAVAWSMSHMMASTRVRLHRAKGQILREGPSVDDHYLRAISYAPDSKSLFALEQNDLVRVVDETLLFEKVQSVAPMAYGREPLAVGVSSGIAGFVSLGNGRFAVLSTTGDLLVVGREPDPRTSDPTK